MTINEESRLPPGQREIDYFPRFGLTQFARRFPADANIVRLRVSIGDRADVEVGQQLERIPRVEQRCDFHCVTTWTRRDLSWSGVLFSDFYRQLVQPLTRTSKEATFVILRAQDGARTSLPLEDLLATDVLLADQLFGVPLSIEHGAPLRLIAPAHYGYKSIKHLNRIEFLSSDANYRPYGFRFMVHPRARVALEERGQWLPGWMLRYLYRPLIRPTIHAFDKAMKFSDHAAKI